MSLGQHATADDPDPGDGWTRPAVLATMPPGEWITVEEEKLRCYNREEGQQISLLINQQKDLFSAAIRWEFERAEFESKIGGLELRLKAQMGLVQEHKDNTEYYRGLWTSTRAELHTSSKLDRWRWVPWILPTVMGLAWGISSAFD